MCIHLAIIMIIFALYMNSNSPSMIDNSIYVTPSLKFPLPVRNGREWSDHKKWPPDTIPLQTTRTSIFSVFVQSWTNNNTVAGHCTAQENFGVRIWWKKLEIILSHSWTWLCSTQKKFAQINYTMLQSENWDLGAVWVCSKN